MINGVRVTQVVIDPHFEKKHSASVNDELIIKLVLKLDGRKELAETKSGRYSYFATLIELSSRRYRLIWLLEDHAVYVGVINAYRDRRRR
jgi:hypothetical protein